MNGPEVRLLRALGEAEGMTIARTVSPAYALSAAATAHAVDQGALARLWLVKLISCSRARAWMTSMTQADDAIDGEIR